MGKEVSVTKDPLDDLFGATLGGALLQLKTDVAPKAGKGQMYGPLVNSSSKGHGLLSSKADQQLQTMIRDTKKGVQAKAKQPPSPGSVAFSSIVDSVQIGTEKKSVSFAGMGPEVQAASPQETGTKESTSVKNARFSFNEKSPQQSVLKTSTAMSGKASANPFQFDSAITADTVLIPQTESAPLTAQTAPAELPVTAVELPQSPALPPVRSGRDGVVRVEIDSQLAVEVGQTEDGVEVLLEGAAKAVEQLRDVGTQLRNALEAGGFSLASFNTSERKDTGAEHVSSAEKAEAKKVPARTKTFFGRGATLQIVA